MKTCVDADSGILLSAKLLEGKAKDMAKEFTSLYGVATATTLRLVSYWFGLSRVVVGDSWFRSYKAAVGLLTRGLFCIVNVKGGHSRFPK